MQTICILTQSHLCRNPRVIKEATTLKKAGYNVIILTIWHNQNLLEEDQSLLEDTGIDYDAYVDIRKEQGNYISTFIAKAERKLGTWLVKHLHWGNPCALGYSYRLFLKKAKYYQADLYICHQELATYIGTRLLEQGFKVAFDLEDWHSEDLLPEARQSRPIALLKRVEKLALIKGDICWTTSQAMANAMAKAYHASPPQVIYNAFPLSGRKQTDHLYLDRPEKKNTISLFWFSQTIGPGRGLEDIIKALTFVDTPLELHLRGNCHSHYRSFLSQIFPNHKHQLFFHELVPNTELLSRIQEHDIGLALEPEILINKKYTISNKILHFILAGIPVIATETKGQLEVAERADGAVFTVPSGTPEVLATIISKLVIDADALKRAKRKASEAAENHFCWEKEKEKLLNLIETAMSTERIINHENFTHGGS